MSKPSRTPQLGEFERAVLLSVLGLGSGAYGVAVRNELEARLERSVSLGAVYTTLDRLEEKGFVSSRHGEPTPQRGGRAKKFFTVEGAGMEALEQSRRAADALWAMSPLRGTR
ncbi:PadR family transcriptional regulator [Sorangium cellulosum]|uniref:PadR family transcriptional regulator n=1 Tax=Sorangium cellulosum TaxID=56 RepID=A0A2L0EKV9_SORCE|nr:helix-turn-helix transcriptional regulator [Sorangium cellulosum]AUX39918.1 PadR family transcriptional regulator [Sorangium cellulosum]